MALNLKQINWVVFLLSIVLASTYAYLGYFESTFYRMELLLIPIVAVISGIITMLVFWLKKDTRPFKLILFLGLCSVVYSTLIVHHLVSTYKPTIIIYIPKHYEGMVYLFPTENNTSEVMVSDNGMGYIPNIGPYQLKIVQDERDISGALNESGMGEIIHTIPNQSQKKYFTFSCFEVQLNRTYPNSPWNQKHVSCMNVAQFDSLVNLQIIDSSKIYMRTWPR